MDRDKHLIPLAIVVAGGLIAAAIYFGGATTASVNTGNTLTTNRPKIEKVTDKDHILGSINAPVIVVEYSDTECPFCKIFHNTMKQVYTDYDGQIAWVYRHFPITKLHARAVKEAEATECAAELGGNSIFWAYLDEIFKRTNSNDSLDPAELPKIAAELGLDTAKFNECLSSGKYTEAIKKDVEEAVRAGAQGTPYSIIVAGDKRAVINGAEPIEAVKAKIDALLK